MNKQEQIQQTIGSFTLELILARMKAEILQDMRDGNVYGGVSDFGTLHEFVDANEYGGFCDDDSPLDGLNNDDAIDVINYCQTRISLWLQGRQS